VPLRLVGSEMCIRDSVMDDEGRKALPEAKKAKVQAKTPTTAKTTAKSSAKTSVKKSVKK
jgi:hypothetical protein